MLRIDEEFKTLIPPLTPEEFTQLEENILTDGIRDPLVVWGDILVDGHNRFELSQKHNITYTTKELGMNDRDDVKRWVINNQFGRRNINNYQRSVLALKLEEIYKGKARENAIMSGKTFGKGLPTLAKPIAPIDTRSELAKTAKVSHGTIDKVKKIEEKAPPEVKQQLNNGDITINKAFSEIKKHERKELIEKQKDDIRQGKIEMPIGKFETIVVDPPWSYGREYDPESSRVANPYPEMSQDDLLKLEIPSADDCIMWLWTTHAFIWDAKELLTEWGFTYKATMVWDKKVMGMGSWLRMQTEFCLLGIKGKPLWNVTNMRDIIEEPRREHSRKPELFYELINKNFVGRRLDYFSRQPREGWEVMGNDINKF